MAVYRIPRGETIVSGRSRCPSCGTQISAIQNVPVFSYLVQRGRCRHCGARISSRYPLTELTMGVLFALLVARFGLSFETAVIAAFFWVLVVLTGIDLEHKLLPNKIVYPTFLASWVLLAAAAAFAGDLSPLISAAIGAGVFGGFLFVVAFIAPAGMGGGDVKLAFVLGTFLGYVGGLGYVLLGMFLSFVLGGVIGIIVMVATGGGRKMQVPFGPFLAGGTVIAILAGDPLLDLYLGSL